MSRLIPAAESRQEQAGEPDANDAPGPGWVSQPMRAKKFPGLSRGKCVISFVLSLLVHPLGHSAGLSLSVAYRLNQSSSGSLQTELALAQSPLEVSTPSLCLLFPFAPPFFLPHSEMLFISCTFILTLILISLHTDVYVKADD